MSRIHCYTDGSGYSVPLTAIVCRWGGGAQPGKYHLFLSTWNHRAGLPLVSTQCVVDDFGDLVEVPR